MVNDEFGSLSEQYSELAFIHDILVVSDDPEHCARVKQFLEAAGFLVTIAKDGGQAHSSFSMRRPDFVILSIILPGESGFEICEHMKQTDGHTPILMLTEVSLKAARELAARAGADGYLSRPFEDDTLREMIEKIGRAAWDRKKGVERVETRKIEFSCACGRKFRMPYANRGKTLNCPKCSEKVVVPLLVENEEVDEHSFRSSASQTASASSTEPLRFVTIKCQHCGTNYHLFSGMVEKARICPKCHQKQVGTLSISRLPLTRAALASSRRVLVILSGKSRGKKLLLPNKEVTIGRGKSCMLTISGSGVEDRHCAIQPVPAGIRVRDLDTEAGTFVNGERIVEEGLLEPGDLLEVGPLKLRLVGDKSVEMDDDDDKSKQGSRAGSLVNSNKPRSIADEAADILHRHWEIIRRLAAESAESS